MKEFAIKGYVLDKDRLKNGSFLGKDYFDNLLLIEKLSDILSEKQKKDKVKNILQAMKREGKIRLNGGNWELA